MARVESFELDHNTVKAPYVRLAGTEQNGDALVENMTYATKQRCPTNRRITHVGTFISS